MSFSPINIVIVFFFKPKQYRALLQSDIISPCLLSPMFLDSTNTFVSTKIHNPPTTLATKLDCNSSQTAMTNKSLPSIWLSVINALCTDACYGFSGKCSPSVTTFIFLVKKLQYILSQNYLQSVKQFLLLSLLLLGFTPSLSLSSSSIKGAVFIAITISLYQCRKLYFVLCSRTQSASIQQSWLLKVQLHTTTNYSNELFIYLPMHSRLLIIY